MSTTLFLAGATGTIGSAVVRNLVGRSDVRLRAGVRDPGKAKLPAGVHEVSFDYRNAELVATALRGVDCALLLTPMSDDQVALGKAFIDAAKSAGVRRIVKLSTMGCEFEPGILLGRWHREVERHLEASGLGYTFVRPNSFMDNFIHYFPPQPDGNIYVPMGQGAVSFIDARDVAAVIAAAMTSEKHVGSALTVTGGEAITVCHAASALAEVTGRAIRHVDLPESAAREAMLGAHVPEWMVNGLLELYALCRAGHCGGVSPTVEAVTGQRPRRFVEFAQEHAAAWASQR